MCHPATLKSTREGLASASLPPYLYISLFRLRVLEIQDGNGICRPYTSYCSKVVVYTELEF
jgi:hypothetical protein